MEDVQQAHGKAARTAQAGAARGNVGDGRDLDAALDLQKLHRLAHKRMLDPLDGVRFFRARVTHPDFLIELLVDRHIDELIDAGRDYRAAEAPIKHRQVAAASRKTDPQGCPADNHAGVCAKSRRTASSTCSASESGRRGYLPSARAAA